MSQENGLEQQDHVPLAAVAFGYAGIIPFVVAATVMWFVDEPAISRIHSTLIGFGLVVLSFMGGIRWGLAMRVPGGPTFLMVGLSIIPAGVSWALFLSGIYFEASDTIKVAQTIALIISFAAMIWADFNLAYKVGVPAWYKGLGLQLTVLTEASLVMALLKILFG